jgi:hypothetical protein
VCRGWAGLAGLGGGSLTIRACRAPEWRAAVRSLLTVTALCTSLATSSLLGKMAWLGPGWGCHWPVRYRSAITLPWRLPGSSECFPPLPARAGTGLAACLRRELDRGVLLERRPTFGGLHRGSGAREPIQFPTFAELRSTRAAAAASAQGARIAPRMLLCSSGVPLGSTS